MFAPITKILVVDNFKTMRKIVIGALGALELKNVTEADDGANAWPLLEAAAQEGAPFGLVISDSNMPVMQGIELLKKVRGHATIKNTPFLFVTAEAEQKNIIEAVQAGVSNYVVKPFTPASLKEKLEQAYKKHAG
jgi:two-component system chemotaxis response regulator CheY